MSKLLIAHQAGAEPVNRLKRDAPHGKRPFRSLTRRRRTRRGPRRLMAARGSAVGVPSGPRRLPAAPTILRFAARSEPWPGDGWRERFVAQREVYRRWYLGAGEAAR